MKWLGVSKTVTAEKLALMLVACGVGIGPATAASTCPADRVVFTDKARGLHFGVERVATAHTYLCNGKAVPASSRPKGDTDCRGPFGDTIYEGFLNGAKVYAVNTVIPAAPCCSWDSYSADSAFAKKQFAWLSGSQVPKVTLGSEWMTIQGDETNPVSGPLGGGKFVPDRCR